MLKKICVIGVLFLLFMVTAGYRGPGVIFASEQKTVPNSKSLGIGSPEKSVDPHVGYFRFYFQDEKMDYVFGSLILGATVNHGCEIGEAFYTASKIKDGDAASWQAEWIKTARLVEARGIKSLAGGHTVSARDQFLRASYYYHMGLISMPSDDTRFKETALKSRALLKKAGTLLSPKLEYIEIPFEDMVLTGYFRKAGPGKNPVKTLIFIGGAETYAEDHYFYIAPQTFDRGYNFLSLEIPGQGLLPLEGKFFRPDMAAPIKAIVDYALSRPDVDPQRLAVYGYSSGGGFAPMAAEKDNRIKAVIMNNAVMDAGAGVGKMDVSKATSDVTKTWSSFKMRLNEAIAWRFGLAKNDLPGLVEANRPMRFDPAKITMPALILVASGEYQSPEIKRQNDLCFQLLPNAKKRMVITPLEEGASNHCIMENRSLMSQELFDWLDEVFQ
ncbi:MAG: alpha/beta hydrolase [Deltaproteobacteria bacterium HGW-Deltaproteobacteria-12]|jgi:hypothetical protein|nr:MAG: alpha/beta hydrolase [Deltaproteobacteria bacterium HGW-Deltaproteobacteria-12]